VVAAAGEDRVGGGQVLERRGGAAVSYLDADPVRDGVALDPVALGLVGFDGDDAGAEAGAFDGDRTRAGPDVPYGLARPRTEAGQHERADFSLGDHRVAVGEGVLGQRPAGRGALVAGQPAGFARLRVRRLLVRPLLVRPLLVRLLLVRRLLVEADEDVGVGGVGGRVEGGDAFP
jgi:hypothetical protein